mmetsp:Transcript_6198/g.9349  ORF Transcript_6198/g.9349 Transcript_6198/m.9349 type:complete len:220 (-) Transcript_6198:171-830(-)|eukprot:CAMPEP_0185031768 /NCGR_PEP_ID=MMETSP1103-20130426/19406_1 /TAXON_ID=36769 /ORGANISM="Paraphysomonas bandaiensis, Strain Caron Lab Isolate" /LENGTH=219 /DNA_ID=CAMNT_0027567405 /DNA_START=55 /DNA_END=714 /DNA_ORIENTATION=+
MALNSVEDQSVAALDSSNCDADFDFDCLNTTCIEEEGEHVETKEYYSWFLKTHEGHEFEVLNTANADCVYDDDAIPQRKTVVPIVMFARNSKHAHTSTGCFSSEINYSHGGKRKHRDGNSAKWSRADTEKNQSSGKLRTNGVMIKRSKTSRKTIDEADSDKMLDILRKHNQKFIPSSLYEPRRHSVRDIRKWEHQNGRTWSSLTPEERRSVNHEITKSR